MDENIQSRNEAMQPERTEDAPVAYLADPPLNFIIAEETIKIYYLVLKTELSIIITGRFNWLATNNNNENNNGATLDINKVLE
jgi:hypothetical protein